LGLRLLETSRNALVVHLPVYAFWVLFSSVWENGHPWSEGEKMKNRKLFSILLGIILAIVFTLWILWDREICADHGF